MAQLLGHGDDDVKVRRRQHLGPAALEPGLGLIGVAFGTAAVLAGVVGEDLGVAMVAAPEVSPEGFGTAGNDVGDGTAMRGGHRGAISRQVSAREPTQDIGELDHGRRPRSQPGHQFVEIGSELGADWLGQMRVDESGGDALVTEQDPGLRRGRLWMVRRSTPCSSSRVA